jgi:hypothetical protein
MADRFDTFTERVPKVLQLAQEEAQRFNHNYIGTERLVREGEGVAAAVLGSLGVTLARTRDGSFCCWVLRTLPRAQIKKEDVEPGPSAEDER